MTTKAYTPEGHRSGEWTYVAIMPPCDLNPEHGPAKYDAKTHTGPWAFMCHQCWAKYARFTTLGIGRGQLLVLREGVNHDQDTT
jgi:hypothetical protein